MQRLTVVLLSSAMALSVLVTSAVAVPAFKKAFDDAYPDAKKVSDEQKCNLCHFGKSKKNKNDYGRALAEHLKKENYKDDRIKGEPDKVKAEFADAFKKVEAAKSKGGDTFGERLKAGKAPGTPEEDK